MDSSPCRVPGKAVLYKIITFVWKSENSLFFRDERWKIVTTLNYMKTNIFKRINLHSGTSGTTILTIKIICSPSKSRETIRLNYWPGCYLFPLEQLWTCIEYKHQFPGSTAKLSRLSAALDSAQPNWVGQTRTVISSCLFFQILTADSMTQRCPGTELGWTQSCVGQCFIVFSEESPSIKALGLTQGNLFNSFEPEICCKLFALIEKTRRYPDITKSVI